MNLRAPNRAREKRPNGRLISREEQRRTRMATFRKERYSGPDSLYKATRDISAGTVFIATGTILRYSHWCHILQRTSLVDFTYGDRVLAWVASA